MVIEMKNSRSPSRDGRHIIPRYHPPWSYDPARQRVSALAFNGAGVSPSGMSPSGDGSRVAFGRAATGLAPSPVRFLSQIPACSSLHSL